ncbi:TOBE domain-containing protein [Sulfurospirillum diekertiae]|uniref:Molybdenum-pterin-binding protein MopA n=1 Tax=Sulfurospirillum diekertiae TaxID=1854492 RepID=A0A1Y0HMP0_9BACT|nr:TOBE domain-containing protein [Sulfurospirillum diekertiae]ARU49210.1 Molybdenum-pterin-binding protein MopA [Sulfurospirillum diekertiae]ASC94020.1 Molybdenum-pterin-binding protein MopA [Sulfurospirillum diekertiae]
MKISARNQITGKVAEIKNGPVNSEIVVATKGGDKIVSVITHGAVESLGLKVGSEALCIFKAQSVLLAKADIALAVSARNKIKGTVTEIKDGAVNCEVILSTPAGLTVTAIVTEDAKKELSLAKGDSVYAIIKASSILVGAN